MAIKKRKIKVQPRSKKVVKSPHWRKCERIYNRLQGDYDDETFCEIMLDIIGMDVSGHLYVEELLSRFDAEVSTLQMNGRFMEFKAPRPSFRVSLKYTDRTKKSKHGHIYPAHYVVKSSPILSHCVTIAYLEICKHIGRFV